MQQEQISPKRRNILERDWVAEGVTHPGVVHCHAKSEVRARLREVGRIPDHEHEVLLQRHAEQRLHLRVDLVSVAEESTYELRLPRPIPNIAIDAPVSRRRLIDQEVFDIRALRALWFEAATAERRRHLV